MASGEAASGINDSFGGVSESLRGFLDGFLNIQDGIATFFREFNEGLSILTGGFGA
jgi:hypothetical protein